MPAGAAPVGSCRGEERRRLREDVLDADRYRLSPPHVGKGCIRYTRGGAVDFDVIRDLLEATRATPGPIC